MAQVQVVQRIITEGEEQPLVVPVPDQRVVQPSSAPEPIEVPRTAPRQSDWWLRCKIAVFIIAARVLTHTGPVPKLQIIMRVLFTLMIAACRFAEVYPEVSVEHFLQPTAFRFSTRVSVLPAHKLYLGRYNSFASNTSEVRAVLAHFGFRPAALPELLWWWITHPMQHNWHGLVFALGEESGLIPFISCRGRFIAMRDEGELELSDNVGLAVVRI